MTATEFHLPAVFDLCATFAFALTGAMVAIARGYDIVGVFFLALASGIGAGLIRDGMFIQGTGPTALLTDPRYILAVTCATFCGTILGHRTRHLQRVISFFDAVGLSAYAIYGTQKALNASLAVPAAILVGVINAVGGGLLRDILTREEPLVFKPGQFLVLSAFAGSVTFILLTTYCSVPTTTAAYASAGLAFVFRTVSILFNWRTTPVSSHETKRDSPEGPSNRNRP